MQKKVHAVVPCSFRNESGRPHHEEVQAKVQPATCSSFLHYEVVQEKVQETVQKKLQIRYML